MPVAIETNHPIEAQMLAGRLRDQGIPAEVDNEASFVVGLSSAAGRPRVVIPDSSAEKAKAILEEIRATEDQLPDDPDYQYEDGEPVAISNWEFPFSIRKLLGISAGAVLLIVILAIFMAN